MKIAFVHCRIQPGWALNVLKNLIDEEKDLIQGKVFTIFSDRKKLQSKNHHLEVVTALPKRINNLFLRSSTHKIPLLSWLFDYRNLMFFYPSLMKILSYKIKKYVKKNKKISAKKKSDTNNTNNTQSHHITISSFAIAKNIKQISGIKTTLYLHSPMQYIRTHYDEYKEKITGFKGKVFNHIVPKLRKRDLKFTKFDKIYANSKYTAKVAEEIYGMNNVSIKYPVVTEKCFIPAVQETPNEYYLYIGRLVNFVRETDKIIQLCNEIKVPLIVMGSGPDEVYLKSIAGPTVIFIWRIQDIDEKIKIISQAKWLINLTKESYGIWTVEAMLLWVPVFGYGQWATAELVDSDCGILVENKEHKTLVEGFENFMHTQRDRKKIAKRMREKWKNK